MAVSPKGPKARPGKCPKALGPAAQDETCRSWRQFSENVFSQNGCFPGEQRKPRGRFWENRPSHSRRTPRQAQPPRPVRRIQSYAGEFRLRRLLRFRLLSLFVIVSVAAFAFWFSLPFQPNIRFSAPESSSYIAVDGSHVPTSVVTVTNDGYFPVWYLGFDGQIRNFSWLEQPSKHPSQPQGDWNGRSTTSADWCKLSHRESVVVEIPNSRLYREAKIGIQVRDWRGRTVDLWSEPFSYAPD
ncbi:hypothetical protein V7x_52280 [Crateriforma conspicua]|uniref:Uncharacterized protein n=1 Tax=Crateriforma conspicua TaxID=2527996 RepID=A0A5C6FJD2_9PLAN|nr:hypothetical protein V7x_52280 [Crateriforma conspicua]